MSVDVELRTAIRAQILADYGEHTIIPGDRMPKVRRLPSRSLGMDYLMAGGYPFGMMTRHWGAFSTGKSTALLNAFWAAQNFGLLRFERLSYLAAMSRMAGEKRHAKAMADQAKRERDRYANGLKSMYVCSEKVFDVDLARKLGVKLDEENLELVMNTRIETVGNIVQQALLGYHLIAVDSTSGTMSIDELGHEDGVEGQSQTIAMNRARKWGYNMDWWRDRISPDNVLIFTSHITTAIGMSARQRVESEKAPGGHKLNHEPSVILHFMKGKWLKNKKTADGGLEEIDGSGGEKGAFGRAQAGGGEVVIRCDKNKSGGRDGRVCLLHYDKVAANFDPWHDYVKLGRYFKVLQGGQSGWYTLPGGERTNQIRTRLAEDETLRHQISSVVLRCAEDPMFERELLRSRGGPGEAMVSGLDEEV
jgi:RecA/RadA recombinase